MSTFLKFHLKIFKNQTKNKVGELTTMNTFCGCVKCERVENMTLHTRIIIRIIIPGHITFVDVVTGVHCVAADAGRRVQAAFFLCHSMA